jgi:competence ComEA-like helix-hairpin-helix protein
MAARIDFNQAQVEDLIAIHGIDGERARRIVAYRSQHGPFHDWDEVERIPGVGPALTERLRHETTLGEDEDEEDEDVDLEIDEEEIAALLAIASLDREAAAAYDVVADAVEDERVREMLRGFAEDHRRHVQDLHAVVRELGAEVSVEPPEGGVLVALAASLGAIDPSAAIEALVANEQLTNGTYETASWIVSSTAADEVVERNATDEQRHLRALLDYQRRDEA